MSDDTHYWITISDDGAAYACTFCGRIADAAERPERGCPRTMYVAPEPGNRWAAFSDDELHTITFGLTADEARGLRDGTRRLQREIQSELERRKA